MRLFALGIGWKNPAGEQTEIRLYVSVDKGESWQLYAKYPYNANPAWYRIWGAHGALMNTPYGMMVMTTGDADDDGMVSNTQFFTINEQTKTLVPFKLKIVPQPAWGSIVQPNFVQPGKWIVAYDDRYTKSTNDMTTWSALATYGAGVTNIWESKTEQGVWAAATDLGIRFSTNGLATFTNRTLVGFTSACMSVRGDSIFVGGGTALLPSKATIYQASSAATSLIGQRTTPGAWTGMVESKDLLLITAGATTDIYSSHDFDEPKLLASLAAPFPETPYATDNENTIAFTYDRGVGNLNRVYVLSQHFGVRYWALPFIAGDDEVWLLDVKFDRTQTREVRL